MARRREAIGGGVGAAVGLRRGELESFGAGGEGEGAVTWREKEGGVARESGVKEEASMEMEMEGC